MVISKEIEDSIGRAVYEDFYQFDKSNSRWDQYRDKAFWIRVGMAAVNVYREAEEEDGDVDFS